MVLKLYACNMYACVEQYKNSHFASSHAAHRPSRIRPRNTAKSTIKNNHTCAVPRGQLSHKEVKEKQAPLAKAGCLLTLSLDQQRPLPPILQCGKERGKHQAQLWQIPPHLCPRDTSEQTR